MKHQLIIVCIGVLTLSLASCAEKRPLEVNSTANVNEIKVAAEATSLPTRTPLPPNVREDANGNLIKSDGWPIQKITSEDKWTRKAKGKTRKGRDVIYNLSTITPEGRPVADAISPNSPSTVWRIRYVEELSGRDGKIFCYRYEATLFDKDSNNNGYASATGYNLCDYDGDGKYEFNGFLNPLIVPEWVRSLPGDPAAVHNNANREPDCGILCSK